MLIRTTHLWQALKDNEHALWFKVQMSFVGSGIPKSCRFRSLCLLAAYYYNHKNCKAPFCQLHYVVPVIGVVWPTEYPYNTIQLCSKHFTHDCRLGVISHSCFKSVQFLSSDCFTRVSIVCMKQEISTISSTILLIRIFFPWLANLSNCVSKIPYHWQHSSGHPKFQIVVPWIIILPYEIKNCLNVICNSYFCFSCWKRSGIADYN